MLLLGPCLLCIRKLMLMPPNNLQEVQALRYAWIPQYTAVHFCRRQKRNKMHGKVAPKTALVLKHVDKWFLVLLRPFSGWTAAKGGRLRWIAVGPIGLYTAARLCGRQKRIKSTGKLLHTKVHRQSMCWLQNGCDLVSERCKARLHEY